VILKILSYNIRFGGSGRENAIAAVIRSANPDIVIFQEGTSPYVIEQLAKSTGLPHWLAKKKHSIAYCSRIKIDHHEWHYPRGSRHPYLELIPEGSSIRIFGVHLRAMFSNWGERRRRLELHSLLTNIEKHQHGFHILLGDFNSLAPNELFEIRKMPGWIRGMIWLSGRDIQRQVVQLMLDNGYVDAFRTLHPEEKGFTFPTYEPHLRFDYFFMPKAFPENLKDCRVIDDKNAIAASDHFPLLAQIEVS
jgi:exodeoxyribonuclease III